MAYRDIPFTYGLPARLVNIAAVATSGLDGAKGGFEIGCEGFCRLSGTLSEG
ncbi:MAG: hypothetical protein R2865_01770 [Deinococcales bacterium]